MQSVQEDVVREGPMNETRRFPNPLLGRRKNTGKKRKQRRENRRKNMRRKIFFYIIYLNKKWEKRKVGVNNFFGTIMKEKINFNLIDNFISK